MNALWLKRTKLKITELRLIAFCHNWFAVAHNFQLYTAV
uniref:Uncharacterized protein n=1 Tax=Anguilla anguilla TaxID=7936 RepID=A0A0E9WNN5_ANGAN